jgi:hypothetical protein
MTQLWSPLKAALAVFMVVVVIGAVVAVVVTSANGAVHDQPFARGQQIGTGVGTVGVIAAAIAYLVQSRRSGR